MQELDIIRIALFVIGMMVCLVTIFKLARLKGIFGTSNKIIGIGVFLMISSLLLQIIYEITEFSDPVWDSLIHIALLMILTLGLGLVFFGLWKVSIFFDELHDRVGTSQISTPSDTEK
jgi:hypothetical protein